MQYRLYVYCRLNNVSRDSGLHDQMESDSQAVALAQLRQSAQELLRYYDTVGCTIRVVTPPLQIYSGTGLQPETQRETERVVAEYTLYS